MAKTKSQKNKKPKITNSVARSDDGTVQINFSIPYSEIEKSQNKVVEDLSKQITVPGFRRGNAPKDKVRTQIPEKTLMEKTISQIFPNLLAEAIKENKLKPAIYPKVELISAKPGETWQVRATTCELPEFSLGEYKKALKSASSSSQIWTPEKGKADTKREPTQQEKEQAAIQALLGVVEITIPNLLIEEEVNARLAKLLQQIEKLGLNLDSYLASVGKNAESLRAEYKAQAETTLKMDLILGKIADEQSLEADKTELEKLISQSKIHKHADGTEHKLSKEELESQERTFEISLKKRSALDYVVSLM